MAETSAPKTKASPISLESVITVVISEDIKPRRKDTKVGEIFSKYKTGMTVGKWLEAVKPIGGGLSHLRKDINFGRIILKAA